MKSKLILAGATVLAITGAPAAHADMVTYTVQETFYEPTYGGMDNTVFNGTFTYDTAAMTITNLTGTLSEAMTGPMHGGVQTLLTLQYNPVPSSSDGSGGIIAHAFLMNNSSIFSDGSYDTSASTKSIANAYATIDVSAAQLSGANTMLSGLSHLYYGDCTSGGMMGNTCMTGWGVSGNAGSMGGYPISEKVSAVPLPPAAWTFLSGMIGFLFFGKQRKSISQSADTFVV